MANPSHASLVGMPTEVRCKIYDECVPQPSGKLYLLQSRQTTLTYDPRRRCIATARSEPFWQLYHVQPYMDVNGQPYQVQLTYQKLLKMLRRYPDYRPSTFLPRDWKAWTLSQEQEPREFVNINSRRIIHPVSLEQRSERFWGIDPHIERLVPIDGGESYLNLVNTCWHFRVELKDWVYRNTHICFDHAPASLSLTRPSLQASSFFPQVCELSIVLNRENCADEIAAELLTLKRLQKLHIFLDLAESHSALFPPEINAAHVERLFAMDVRAMALAQVEREQLFDVESLIAALNLAADGLDTLTDIYIVRMREDGFEQQIEAELCGGVRKASSGSP